MSTHWVGPPTLATVAHITNHLILELLDEVKDREIPMHASQHRSFDTP